MQAAQVAGAGRIVPIGLVTIGLVTVVAARCVQAEVASTAAFVLGPQEGAHFLPAAGGSQGFLHERGLAGWLARDDGPGQAVGAWPAPLEDA